MGAVKALLRWFSYLYHGLLALFLLAVSVMALSSGAASLRLEMLPWQGATLAWTLLFTSLIGLASIMRSIRRGRGGLLFLWSLVVAFMLVKGYLFSSYRFAPGTGVATAVYLVLGSCLALIGAWFALPRNRPAGKKQ